MGEGGIEVNTRLLHILLIVQFVFAGALIFVGVQVRSKRRLDYLELTHRVTSGRARREDFEKLAAFLSDRAQPDEVRALFGLPLQRANDIEVEIDGKLQTLPTESWIYYFDSVPADPENALAPIDRDDAEKLTGLQLCFVVSFSMRHASEHVLKVMHPLPTH